MFSHKKNIMPKRARRSSSLPRASRDRLKRLRNDDACKMITRDLASRVGRLRRGGNRDEEQLRTTILDGINEVKEIGTGDAVRRLHRAINPTPRASTDTKAAIVNVHMRFNPSSSSSSSSSSSASSNAPVLADIVQSLRQVIRTEVTTFVKITFTNGESFIPLTGRTIKLAANLLLLNHHERQGLSMVSDGVAIDRELAGPNFNIDKKHAQNNQIPRKRADRMADGSVLAKELAKHGSEWFAVFNFAVRRRAGGQSVQGIELVTIDETMAGGSSETMIDLMSAADERQRAFKAARNSFATGLFEYEKRMRSVPEAKRKNYMSQGYKDLVDLNAYLNGDPTSRGN